MKLVREHINEKFTENTDSIWDMEIGLPKTMNNIIEKILDLDMQEKLIESGTTNKGNINHIIVSKGNLIIRYYSNPFKKGETLKQKIRIRKQYYIDLIKRAGISDMVEKGIDTPLRYRITFKIKQPYIRFFPEGYDYDELDYDYFKNGNIRTYKSKYTGE